AEREGDEEDARDQGARSPPEAREHPDRGPFGKSRLHDGGREDERSQDEEDRGVPEERERFVRGKDAIEGDQTDREEPGDGERERVRDPEDETDDEDPERAESRQSERL